MFTTRGILRFSFDCLLADVLPDRKDILSLDGGGFQGLSSLVILDHISARPGPRACPFTPNLYFDLRESTGGTHRRPSSVDWALIA